MKNKTIALAVASAAGLVLSMTSVESFAQEAGAQGTVTAQATATAPQLPPAQAAPAPAPVAVATATTTTTREDDTPDHERFVGHFAVGYFGISQLPIGAVQGTGLARDNVQAPVVGVRYWLMRDLGLDIGVGFGLKSESTETVNGGTSVTQDQPSNFGLAVHGGVPLAFAHGKHYSFLVIPEATVGFTSGTIKGTNNNPDIDLSGFKLDLGGRIGAEIHFGFIGVPELSLEGSVGLFFRREAWKIKADQNSASDGITTLGTSVQSDPWALFVNNISAFYYF